ncbi:MAG: TfuA-like protein, partial [Granulosicoccus sp.]
MNLIFAGPTISCIEITQYSDCVCLPPIRQGDILKHLSKKPVSIGIIDGYFEGAPAIWHKEILYALDQGVYVYGSSSMGALRAAELHSFGMQGIGQIFEWYRDGVITDDDEVAVLHGPEETHYLTASEPMVNIRATLDLATQRQIINRCEQKSLLAVAKNTFYKKRSWRNLLADMQDSIGDDLSKEQFVEWVQLNKLDLKKQDAIQLLQTIQKACEKHTKIHCANFHFEWTNVWDAAYQEYVGYQRDSKSVAEHQQVLDQLRLMPD